MFEMDFNLKPQPWKANTSLALSIASYQISFSTLILDVIVYKTRKTRAEKRIRKAKRAARRGETLHLSIPKLAFSKIYKCLTSHSDTTVEDYSWWRSWIEHFAQQQTFWLDTMSRRNTFETEEKRYSGDDVLKSYIDILKCETSSVRYHAIPAFCHK